MHTKIPICGKAYFTTRNQCNHTKYNQKRKFLCPSCANLQWGAVSLCTQVYCTPVPKMCTSGGPHCKTVRIPRLCVLGHPKQTRMFPVNDIAIKVPNGQNMR